MYTEGNVEPFSGGSENKTVQVSSNGEWEKLLSAFIQNLDAKDATKKQYRKTLTLFFQWADNNHIDVRTLTRAHILAYRKELLEGERRLSGQTVAAYIVGIRRLFEWAEAEKIYPNIAKGIKAPRVRKDFIKQHLTSDECTQMLENLFDDIENKTRQRLYKQKEANGLRDYAIINLLLRTGLRTVEVARLDVGDITFRRRKHVLLVWGKGHDTKDDYVPLSDKAYAPIMTYLATRPSAMPTDPLFVCEGYGSRGRRISPRRIQAICKEALRSIGLDDHAFSAHSFRHTCAVMLIQSGASAYDTQKYLRHSSIDTTEIYLRSIEEDLRLERSPERMLDNKF